MCFANGALGWSLVFDSESILDLLPCSLRHLGLVPAMVLPHCPVLRQEQCSNQEDPAPRGYQVNQAWLSAGLSLLPPLRRAESGNRCASPLAGAFFSNIVVYRWPLSLLVDNRRCRRWPLSTSCNRRKDPGQTAKHRALAATDRADTAWWPFRSLQPRCCTTAGRQITQEVLTSSTTGAFLGCVLR